MSDKSDILSRLHPGEPYFIIRAQDVYSPAAIQSWSMIAKRQKAAAPIIKEFIKWQKDNPNLVKEPD